MMNIGLIDVDGHHFPNLALMRISAYHKSRGDNVEWWFGNLKYYDKVYMSKVFSSAYSEDAEEPINCGEVIKGGTGYAIYLDGGVERYDPLKDKPLLEEIEHMFPDYSIYPQYDFAVSMTSRGCPRGCAFCHVAAKEGRCSRKVADVTDFWNGQKLIKILDPNITACKDKYELYQQYIDTGAKLDFTQGLDIRLINGRDMDYINRMRLEKLHFAWDNPADDLESAFRLFKNGFRRKSHIGTVYILTGFGSTMKENLYRIRVLSELGYDPYVMIYNKPQADKQLRALQRWCNNKIIFKSCKRFEDYHG